MTRQSRQDADEPPRRRNRAQAVGTAVRAVGGKALARAGFSDATLVERWTEIVGPEIARLTRPIKIVDSPGGGTLTLKAEPAASVFLQHEGRSLCERINTYLGRQAVVRLRFAYGNLKVADPRPPAAPRRPSPAPKDDPATRFDGSADLKSALLGLAAARNSVARHSGD